ncbi:MAG: hypothetical protein P1U80_02235 [Pseudomonadales bacterium]|nr:hypothetical protein [Pseudomonadales bacterium]
MKYIKQLVGLLLLIPVILFVVIFVTDNPELISMQLLGFSIGTLSSGAWIMLSFVVGGVAGLLSGSVIIFRLRTRLMLLNRNSNN